MRAYVSVGNRIKTIFGPDEDSFDEHYRRFVNVTTKPPIVQYLFIPDEHIGVAYQRYLRLSSAYKDTKWQGWIRVGSAMYGMFLTFGSFELARVDYPSGHTTIWKCKTPSDWFCWEEPKDLPELYGSIFVEEFFEFVDDYEERDDCR